MLKKQIKNTILSFIIILPVIAQSQSIRFNHISIEQGLSQNMVRDIMQDSRGFMWFATWDGLNRYDGYEFKVYKNIDGDSTSLRTNKISSIYEDHLGRLWVGTFGGGLSLFDRKSESFTNFLHNENDSFSIGSNRIMKIFEDSKNRLWIGTLHGGLSLVEEQNNIPTKQISKRIRFRNFINNPDDSLSITSDDVVTIFEDSYHSIWISFAAGYLNKLVDSSENVNDYKFIKYNPGIILNSENIYNSFEHIIEDKNHHGLLWLVSYYSGLIWFDVNTGKFLLNYPYQKLPSDFPDDIVESILVDSDSEFWFGTYSKGVYSFILDKRSDSFSKTEHYDFTQSDPFGLTAPNITDLYEDKSGLIWIGTNTNGLYTFNKRTKDFWSFHHNSNDNNSLIGDNVLGVLEDRDGIIWIGTEIGLDKFNPVTKKYTHYKHNPDNSGSISSDIVYAVHQDNDGTIWVGTEAGLDKYNPSSDSFSHFIHNPHDSNSISKGEIIELFTDSKGEMWLGSWNGGLNKLVKDEKGNPDKFLHYVHIENDSFSISNNKIMVISEDQKGRLWIGTSDGGLNQLIRDYNYNSDGTILKPQFKSYLHDPNDPSSLSNNDVRCILIDDEGILWLGTFGGGVNKFNPPDISGAKAEFFHFKKENGLANDVVRGILQDNSGNLWIGTAYGLSKLNPASNTILNFGVQDGLQTAKFEDAHFHGMKTGTMYFGGVGGVIAFNPDKIKANPFTPDVVITSLKKFHINGETGTMIDEKGISDKKEIVLSYADNILNIEFAALNYYNSAKNIYSYKLEGYSDNWISLGTKREVTFTNLDPGKYTFYVKGANNDGVWNEKRASLDIIITPPWWRSQTAFIFYGLMVLMGILITDRVMRRRIIKKERDRAKLREAELVKKQAQELETVDRLVRVINNAEDLETLFNSLLEQTVSLIPNAEKAAVFILDHKDNKFHVAFTFGYRVDDLESITFLPDDLKRRYTESSEEIEKGIYIINETYNLFGDEKFSKFDKAKSMLIMAVEWDNRLEAYVVLDSFEDKNAFDASTARILNRFREHAISAISKAQSIKMLQDKNEEIVKTQEQLITQQKLASLGALTAGIAHEIKNPLNFVNNFASLSSEMLDELDVALKDEKNILTKRKYEDMKELIDDLKSNFERVANHGNRADNIIKGMLLHSRGSSHEKTATNLNDLLDQYLNLAYHGLRAQDKEFNITIEKDYDETIGNLNIVPQDMSRVFLNVINNACYAANKKKCLNDENNYRPILKVTTKNFGKQVEIRIKDNGNGIPDDLSKKIFNPFFTTKPAGEGTGLGLSLSYDIVVKEHSGELKFNSEVGEYTEFIITLPIE